MNPNLLVILPHNKTDCFLYVLKSRPGPSFVPTIFSIRPFVDSVLLFSKSCWILFEFEEVYLLLLAGELLAAHLKMHVATQRLQSTSSLAQHSSPTHL